MLSGGRAWSVMPFMTRPGPPNRTTHEHWQEKFAKDQVQSLYPHDRRNLSSELGKLHERVAEAEDDHAIEANQLSRSIREISDDLVDMNMLPIWDVPSQLQSVKDVLAAFSLILEQL
jgi:hypothetical protein